MCLASGREGGRVRGQEDVRSLTIGRAACLEGLYKGL